MAGLRRNDASRDVQHVPKVREGACGERAGTSKGRGKRLLARLVADPPLRAPKNRARFLELVDAGGFESTSATRRTKVTHAGSTDVVLLLELRAKA